MRTLDPTREQHILCSAAQLFARRHYHEVRMEDVAAHAGVAKGTLYRYFEDKDDLYRALTIHGLHRLIEESQDRIAGPGSPEDRLLAYVTGVVRFYERQPYFLDLIARVETSRSAASVAALQTIRSQFLRLSVNLLTALDAPDPELAALALSGLIRGILRFRPQPWPDDLPGWIYRQFLHGLRPAPPASGESFPLRGEGL